MPDALWVVDADVAFVDSPDRVALIQPGRPDQAPVILEDSGAAIWMALRERATPTSATDLGDQLGIPVDAVADFLGGLAALGLVELT